MNPKLSVIIPCYNEAETLEACVLRVFEVLNPELKLEIIIVDDCSNDQSPQIAQRIAKGNQAVRFFRQARNQGKGAALKTGIEQARGDIIAIQDADLEYDPADLRMLLQPIINRQADVVLGSRFLTGQAHRVFHFWHAQGNRLLTLLSNMFTDLNLTDMETCYKVFRAEVIKEIDLQEKRFGFEPEIIAKVARQRLRIYEMGISYAGRSYSEGKKIGWRDGLRAVYCILKYNLPHAPLPIQFVFYTMISALAAATNLICFLLLYNLSANANLAAPVAFFAAAALNYLLCVKLIFRHQARWRSGIELLLFIILVCGVGLYDWASTSFLINHGTGPMAAKIFATGSGLFLNFLGRRYLIFPEKNSPAW